jgi:hypothetical protein
VNPHDIVLTGVPRSGTTLTCSLLDKLDNTVALREPMYARDIADDLESNLTPNQGELPHGRHVGLLNKLLSRAKEARRTRRALRDHHALCDREAAFREIREFFEESRSAALSERRIYTKHRDGVVFDNGVMGQKGQALREPAYERSWIEIEKPLNPDFTLVVKHPSVFAALLDGLSTQYSAFAVVRNPLGVLSSWNTVKMAVGRGHAPAAERFNPRLRAELEAIPDILDRQIHLLSWFFNQFRELLPADHVLRYEDIVRTQGKALSVIQSGAQDLKLQEPLESRNNNEAYAHVDVHRLADRLLASDGGYWHFYTREDVQQVLAS